MNTKISRSGSTFEVLPILAAFIFVAALMIGSSGLMILAAILIAIRFSLHVVNYARPIPQHFRKHRPAVRYAR